MKSTKKYFNLINILALSLFITSCGGSAKDASKIKPDVEQIKSIIKLTTVKVSYNNLAKSVKLKPSGIFHIGEKDRPFWVEYTGSANLGIDISKVDIDLSGNKIVVSMPEPEIIGIPAIDEKSFNENSYVFSTDSFNSNPITMDDQKAAITDAQNKMRANILANETLKNKARNVAKEIITNYVDNINSSTKSEYVLEFKQIKKID